MHLISGRPGFYHNNQQICFANKRNPPVLVDTLEQIKDQQRLTKKWRKAKGFKPDNDYDWIRVKV